MKKPTMKYLPARHYRTPRGEAAFEAEDLPFLWFDSQYGTRWNMVHQIEYGVACDLGMECAAHFVQLMRDNPNLSGANPLGDVVDGMADAPRGVMIGFLDVLGSLLAMRETTDPFDFVATEIKRGNDAMAEAEAAIEAAREATEMGEAA